jgi:hypothetical protein
MSLLSFFVTHIPVEKVLETFTSHLNQQQLSVVLVQFNIYMYI